MICKVFKNRNACVFVVCSDVHEFLNYEHRVFNSEEFLRSREPEDLNIYKKVRF